MSIHKSAMLCSLELRTLGNSRKDVQATKDSARQQMASVSALRVSKELLPNNRILTDINKLDSAMREVLRTHALPWSKAAYLVPTANCLKLKDTMRVLMDEREALVADFIADYPRAVAAAAIPLGNCYNPSEYAPVEHVRQRFVALMDFMPVPEAGDFRVDVDAAELDEMRKQYEQQLARREQEMAVEAWTRLHDSVEHIVDRLTSDDGKTNKVFRETMIDNARELVVLLRGFNVNNDPDLETARRALSDALDNTSSTALRNSPTARENLRVVAEDVRATAQTYLDKFGV